MSYRDVYEKWLSSSALSEAEKEELRSISGDEKEIESRFFAPLEFGTAGLRGTMCVGLHQMNIHVIRHATQAFAEVILAEGPEAVKRGVAVCFDCRNHSQEFARETAGVMAGNGIPVRIFESLRPTPELSFAVREYGCIAGVNVTASHNPKEYNGYKVYWQDGAQLPPHHAEAIAKKMEELDFFASIKRMDYDEAVEKGLITVMGAETDEKFLSNVMGQVNDKAAVEKVADTFKMVYTPFHGTGYKLIPEALRRLGMKHVICVPEQMVIDGNFPTVVSPNPENPEGFYLAVDLAKKEGADFILGSDPDADRVGIMVRTSDGEFKVLTGNQTGATAFFLWMVSLLAFLALDGHLYMIKGFAASFALVPPGGLFIGENLLWQVLDLAAQVFVLALKIAAPVMVALFMVEVALALVARTSPQIHIMEFGFPIKIGVGFFFVGLLLVVMADHVEHFINGMDGLFTHLLRAMSPFYQ